MGAGNSTPPQTCATPIGDVDIALFNDRFKLKVGLKVKLKGSDLLIGCIFRVSIFNFDRGG